MATMYVYNIPTDETVNLRKTASSSGTVLVRVGYGKAVDASASTTAGWHNASYSGYSGYIMSTYLTSTDPNGGGTGSWVTRWTNTPGETVNIRSGPGTSYEIVYKYSHGTKVEVNAPNATWSQVRLSGSTSNAGYVMTEFLVSSDPTGGGGTTVTLGDWVTVGIVSGGCTTYKTPSTSGEVYSGIGSAGGVVTAYLYKGTNQDSWLVYKTSNINTFFLAKYARGNEYNTSQTGRRARITGSGVNLREVPSTSNNSPFTTLDKNTTVLFLDVKDGFRRVLTPKGMGWVHGDYMEEF